MHTHLHIQPFQIKDISSVLHLIKLNTPDFFAKEEEEDFIDFLKHQRTYYYVVKNNDEIMACGGFNFLENNTIARLCWDMVHPDYHGKGIGSALVQFRLEELMRIQPAVIVEVRTTQLANAFYEKHGFKCISIEKDYWAVGFDLYHMRRD